MVCGLGSTYPFSISIKSTRIVNEKKFPRGLPLHTPVTTSVGSYSVHSKPMYVGKMNQRVLWENPREHMQTTYSVQ